jgi:hypothetical protein
MDKLAEFGINGDGYVFGYFLIDHAWYIDLVIGQRHHKCRLDTHHAALDRDGAFDDAFLRHAMNRQRAFGADGVGAIGLKINLFDDFACEGGTWVFVGF